MKFNIPFAVGGSLVATTLAFAATPTAEAPANEAVVTEAQAAQALPEQVDEEDQSRPRWYVYAGAGVMYMNGPVDNQPVFFDVKLGYDLTERWSIEGGMIYAPIVSSHKGATDVAAGPAVDVLYHLLEPYSRWDIYASVGVGYLFGDHDRMFAGGWDSAVLYRLGAGVAYHLTDNLSIRLDGKVMLPTQALIKDSFEHNLVESLELGLLYRFGGETSQKAPEVIPATPREVVVDATPDDEKDTMTLETYVNYDYDQTIIKPEYYAPLNDVARMIKKAIARNPNVKVSVEGHADRRHKSSKVYNQKLSEARAVATKNYLVAQGIDEKVFTTIGYGFTKPKVKPDLDNGNPENRRVDVIIQGAGDKAAREELKKN